jgi:phosphoribosylformylglycinamidine synthase subunit PurQ / glutaminase
MNVAVICFPGTNRDQDLINAFSYVTGRKPRCVWYTETTLPRNLDLVILPGGFAHGDQGRPGACAAGAPVMDAVRAHGRQGGFILGLCNGFQVLCESALLPGRLERNQHRTFISRLQSLRIESQGQPFTACYPHHSIVFWPIAHGNGNYQCKESTLEDLKASDRIAVRYCNAFGDVTYASNPNGSVENIAGIYSASKRILGMMPHPENAVDSLTGLHDGRRLFLGLLENMTCA